MTIPPPRPTARVARRATASLLAGGLVAVLATAPALAAPLPSDVGPASAAVTGSVFVQEGMPTARAGQVVVWGDRASAYDPSVIASVPAALPGGVHATALSTDGADLLVLRSDGRVDSRGSGRPVTISPPDGTTFVGVAAREYSWGRLLRSDGAVVSQDGQYVTQPPAGITFTAIAGQYTLRSDGALEPPGEDAATCAGAFDPGPGLRYTAISARGSVPRWAALRSDGAYVYCAGGGPEEQASVVMPPSGARFVGLDLGGDGVLAATDDGRVLSSDGTVRAKAPDGRSIVSLTAMEDAARGAATLDDGTILDWGLTGRDAALPAVPDARAVYSTVAGDTGYGVHWAIMIGDAIPVDVTVDPEVPTDRPLRVTDTVRFQVTARLADGTPADGRLELVTRAPDGRANDVREGEAFEGAGQVTFPVPDHEQVGTYGTEVSFVGSPFVTSTNRSTLALAAPAPIAITTSGPSTWRATSEERDTLCYHLATSDGSPRWWPRDDTLVTVEGHPEYADPNASTDGGCLDRLNLPPGSYTVHIEHTGWGEADSASWTGAVTVLPPATTTVTADLPTSWPYGRMPDVVWATVTSDDGVPRGSTRLELDGSQLGFGSVLDESGRGRLWLGSDDELPPGTYSISTRYLGGEGFAPSRLERTVTVTPAAFTSSRAAIAGTPTVGRTLTAVPGTWTPAPTRYRYLWRVNGAAVAGATASTFVVPASAAGKRVTVTITGLGTYLESSVTSAPTAAVAPGTFTAPRPVAKGTAKVGKTLTVSRGTWSPSPSSVRYVWKANGATVATRTTSSFVVPASARGKRLTVTVTGSRSGYTARSVTSAPTATVVPGTFTAPRPTISGTKRVGRTLTVSRGTWSPAPSSVKYVWKANGRTIATKTVRTFVVPAKARGKHLTVTVVGSRAGYVTRAATSSRTVTIR